MSIAAQFERAPDNVGATACRHDLVAGRNERRAHDWRVLATTPAAVALLEIADERSVLEGEGQTWLERQLDWFREIIAEVIVDLVGEPENFSGIENIFWIERALDLAHDIQERIAELLAHVFRAGDPDSVFGRERTFELSNERGSLIGHEPELSQIVRAVEVENGTDMQQTARGMAVVTRLESERFHDRLQAADVIGQLRRAHRGIFDKCDRFRRTDTAGQERAPGLAHGPNEIHFVRVAANLRAQPKIAGLQDRQLL